MQYFYPTIRSYGGYLVYCVFVILFIIFVYTVTDFSAAVKGRGVKFCTHVRLLSGMSFSHFSDFGSRGVTAAALLYRNRSGGSRNWVPWLGGHSELGAAA